VHAVVSGWVAVWVTSSGRLSLRFCQVGCGREVCRRKLDDALPWGWVHIYRDNPLENPRGGGCARDDSIGKPLKTLAVTLGDISNGSGQASHRR
jgi:hypothetical protein